MILRRLFENLFAQPDSSGNKPQERNRNFIIPARKTREKTVKKIKII